MSQDYFYGLIALNNQHSEQERQSILERYPAPIYHTEQSTFNIEQEVHGNLVSNIVVLVNEYKVEKASNGNSYLKLRFENSIGTFNAKLWDNDGAVEYGVGLLEEHTLFELSGKIEEFRGYKSFIITSMRPIHSTDKNKINPFDLLPSTVHNVEDLTVELYAFVSQLDSPYREITFTAMDYF